MAGFLHGKVDQGKLTDPAEISLFSALGASKDLVAEALEEEKFAAAMRHMAAFARSGRCFF